MVSFHKALAESPKTEVPLAEFEAPSKKRKWEEPLTTEELFKDQTKAEKTKSIFDIELHLETPLPSDKWRQYLSIQSGQIHLCNTWMNTKTPEDSSKRSLESPSPAGHMSLDLELNLTCDQSLRKKEEDSYGINEKQNSGFPPGSLNELDLFIESNKCTKRDSGGLTRSPSWLSSEEDHKEMVATVCMRCHMLVMLCKSSPSCPNCKFMHPPDQNPSKFLKRRCSLLC